VPLRLRNAPTAAMKEWGYGAGYKYPHDFAGNYVHQDHLPETLAGQRLFEPKGSGAEAAIRARLAALRTPPQSSETGDGDEGPPA
jgi:putative ATPase